MSDSFVFKRIIVSESMDSVYRELRAYRRDDYTLRDLEMGYVPEYMMDHHQSRWIGEDSRLTLKLVFFLKLIVDDDLRLPEDRKAAKRSCKMIARQCRDSLRFDPTVMSHIDELLTW